MKDSYNFKVRSKNKIVLEAEVSENLKYVSIKKDCDEFNFFKLVDIYSSVSTLKKHFINLGFDVVITDSYNPNTNYCGSAFPVPNKGINHCCFEHDNCYTNLLGFWKCNTDFYKCIKKKGKNMVAYVYSIGVTIGGWRSYFFGGKKK